jgi:broad specificity phosphatase PhoE
LRTLCLITHPDVVVDPAVPVADWPLSERGRLRMTAGLRQPWVAGLSSVYASAERKAQDGAGILARHLGLAVRTDAGLGENDRSSTGYLPRHEFEAVANEFFAHPERSVRGWERAVDAQRRIVAAVHRIHAADPTRGGIALVSHGAVGTLLYCHLARVPISRVWDQPANGGGNCFAFTLVPEAVESHWRPFDRVP